MKKFWMALIVVIVGPWLVTHHHKTKVTLPPPKTYNSISDESLGLAFNISKDFEEISKPELVKLNPSNIYGYRSQTNKTVGCFVSRTPLIKPGVISAKYLANGTFQSIKNNHPAAKLVNWSPVNDRPAVFLDVNYLDNKQKIEQPELVLVNSKNTIFAFCQVPESLKASYQPDFTTFFSSMKLIN